MLNNSVLMIMRNNTATVDSGRMQGRIFSYLRWSTPEQTWGDSERRQNAMAEAWCARHGVALAGTEVDQGVSAFKGANRRSGTGLDRLLRTMVKGDVLLIEDADRWSREKPLDSLNALRDTVGRGIRLVLLRTGTEITADNFDRPEILFPAFFGSFLANQESAKKAVRVKASWDARKQAAMEGKAPVNQNMPSWLKWDAVNKKVLLIPERAETVRQIFELYNDGLSIRQVCDKLRAEGVPNVSKRRDSKGWSVNLIGGILRSKAAMGVCCGVPGLWPRVVSDKDFFAAQAKLDISNHLSGPRAKREANLFGGLTVCSQCGQPMNKMTYSRKKKTVRSYLVCGAAAHAKSDCGSRGIRYDVFEHAVLNLNGAEIVKRLSDSNASSPLDDLKAKLALVQDQADAWFHKIEGDPNPSPRIMRALRDLEAQEATLQKQIDQEAAKAKAAAPPLANYKAMVIEQAAVKVNREKCRTLLRGFIDKIVCDTKGQAFTVHFKGDKEPMPVALIKAG